MGDRKYLYFDYHRIPNVSFWARFLFNSSFPFVSILTLMYLTESNHYNILALSSLQKRETGQSLLFSCNSPRNDKIKQICLPLNSDVEKDMKPYFLKMPFSLFCTSQRCYMDARTGEH